MAPPCTRRLVLARVVLALVAGLGLAVSQRSMAQPVGAMGAASSVFPNRPIRVLVAATPGGGPDLVARLMAPRMAEALGQPVLVENRAGGNGSIAAEVVARSAPDGHVLLMGMDSLIAINPHLYLNMPVDTVRDLLPIASLISNGMVLVVHPSQAATTLAEFIELARRSNPPLHYASGGNGSQHHLTMERLKARADIDLVHVPYKGGAPATAATVAGEVAAMMSGTSTASQIRSGRLRALAVTSPARSQVLPDVPAIAETLPDFEMTQWYGLFGPVGLPEVVINRIRTEAAAAITLPAVRERLLAGGGLQPWITTREAFAAHIREDLERYGKVVREAGARLD